MDGKNRMNRGACDSLEMYESSAMRCGGFSRKDEDACFAEG